jgi:hypothetical protein
MTFNLPKTQVPMEQLVRGMGYFSIGLGLAELLAPRQVSRGAGMHHQNYLLRGFGLREIATGIGLLTTSNPRPWLWGRVAGDVLDVATVAITADGRRPGRLGSSFAALLGVGLLDLYCAIQSLPQRGRSRVGSSHDYRKRSGFPRGIEQMRGTAVKSAKDKAAPPAGLREARPA